MGGHMTIYIVFINFIFSFYSYWYGLHNHVVFSNVKCFLCYANKNLLRIFRLYILKCSCTYLICNLAKYLYISDL